MPILMLTAADRLDDKASGFGLRAVDYLTKPSNSRNSCSGSEHSTAGARTRALAGFDDRLLDAVADDLVGLDARRAARHARCAGLATAGQAPPGARDVTVGE